MGVAAADYPVHLSSLEPDLEHDLYGLRREAAYVVLRVEHVSDLGPRMTLAGVVEHHITDDRSGLWPYHCRDHGLVFLSQLVGAHLAQ